MTAKGFRRSVPAVAGERGSGGRAWDPDRDAVNLLLIAFGYPTIPPEPPVSGTRRIHKAITEQDDDDEET